MTGIAKMIPAITARIPTTTGPSRSKATRRMSAVSHAWKAYQPVTRTARMMMGTMAPFSPNTYLTVRGKFVPHLPLP